MAVTLDPRLEEIAKREEQAKQDSAAVAEAPVAPSEELVPDATLEAPATAEEQNPEPITAPEPAQPDNRLYIDPARGHYQELTRLEQQDEAIRNAIRTRVGREAAKAYKPKIAELEHERNQLRAELQRLKNESIDVEELKVKLLDPEFRRQYDAANTPEGPDPRTIAWFEASFTEAVEEAEKHLPPEIIGRYTNALSGQWYDYERDAQGKPIRALSPEEAMRRFQFDLNRASINYVKQAQAAAVAPVPEPPKAAPAQPVAQNPEPAPAPVSKPNLALSQSSPDLTPNSVGRAAGVMSLTEYNRMNPVEKIKLFPEGLQAALDSGKVTAE